MVELNRLFTDRRAQFERDIAAMPDPKGAFDVCARYLGDVRRDYIGDATDPQLRIRLGELMSASESGVQLMVAVSQVDIKMGLRNGIPQQKRRIRLAIRAMLPYVPLAMMALIAVWLYFDGKLEAAIAALIAGAVSMFTLLRLKPPAKQTVPDVYGETHVDPALLSKYMEQMLRRMDDMLSAQPAMTDDSPLTISSGLMESVQMLMEARITGDGAFALKALPQMMAALSDQGVEIEMYTSENRANFDLLPAEAGGETIRPALIKDGRLLFRGQATIKG